MEELRSEFEKLQSRWEEDHEELRRLRASQSVPMPTLIVQRERKLRRYNGTAEPLLADWVEEARTSIQAQQLSGESAASFLLSYLDGAARLEVRCQPPSVQHNAERMLTALEEVFGRKENSNQLLRRFFDRRQLPGEPIASFSHSLIEIVDRINRLAPKGGAERDMMLRDQFVENVLDVHLRWELKRRIENGEIDFLSLRKIAMQWADEVEGAARGKVRANAIQVNVERAEESSSDSKELWAELATQRRLWTEGLAEQGRVLSEVLEHQRQLLALRPPPAIVPHPRASATRWSHDELVCYNCGRKGHIRRNCPTATDNSPPALN